MKIVSISDIHGYLPKNLPEGNVLCIAGDIVPGAMQRDAERCLSWFKHVFMSWINSLPYDKIFLVAGNHDFLFQILGSDLGRSTEELMEIIADMDNKTSKLIYLQDTSYEYQGYTFYGSPWISTLRNWAFYKTDEELIKIWENIPEKCDVLITHTPPKISNYGTVLEGYWNFGTDYGCESLMHAVSSRNIKYHIFGHVHSGLHDVNTIGGTNFANVSLLSESYHIKYEPLVFEI